ncbi:MAG: hypothetical protein KF819_30785 [Labilithrix sp.]|nr:hypothetical protein [Labilithrix sp.]
MECGDHPGVDVVSACGACKRGVCEACATYEIDGGPCCERCGRAEDERARSLGSALLALVGVGYLATLALGVAFFKARPFVGGVAAIVAIALGRALQLWIKPSAVTRRSRA